jgi:signal transduction histidine kinase/ActR/RegA family two-component response regulator
MTGSDEERIAALLAAVIRMAAGDLDATAPVSPAHDHIDALAHGINVLVGELGFATRAALRAREAAERSDRGKMALLRSVSHELRTPLAVLVVLSELFDRHGTSDEDRARLVGQLRANARALSRLVDDLLELGRLDADKVDVLPALVAPLEVVADVVESLRPQADAKGLTLGVGVEEGAAAPLVTDAGRLRQILMNLVFNAVKFTEKGSVHLTLARRDDGLAIDVADSGRGMLAADAPRLFEPFAQADGVAAGLGGFGLGLAIARQLARRLGGDLRLVASAPGAGSTFRVTLPVAAPATGSAPGAPSGGSPMSLRALALAEARILLVEDDPDLQDALAGLLRAAGATVAVASDGEEAVARASLETFDVVVMDIAMPRLDGLEATRRLRAAGYRAPIVALSAYGFAEQAEESRRAGCDDHIVKPVEVEVLIARLLHLHHAKTA